VSIICIVKLLAFMQHSSLLYTPSVNITAASTTNQYMATGSFDGVALKSPIDKRHSGVSRNMSELSYRILNQAKPSRLGINSTSATELLSKVFGLTEHSSIRFKVKRTAFSCIQATKICTTNYYQHT